MKIHNELFWALKQAQFSGPTFSAVFYAIKRSTLCNIFASIISYTIVFKQFDNCVNSSTRNSTEYPENYNNYSENYTPNNYSEY